MQRSFILDGSLWSSARIAAMLLISGCHKPSFTVSGAAGPIYHIILVLRSGARRGCPPDHQPERSVSIGGDHPPVILEPPLAQTVANGRALFKVIADGVQPLSYQGFQWS